MSMEEDAEITVADYERCFKFATLFDVAFKDRGKYKEYKKVIHHFVPIPHDTPEVWFDSAIEFAKLYGLVPSRASDGVAIIGPCLGPSNTLSVFLFLEPVPGAPVDCRASMRITIMRDDEDDWEAAMNRVNKAYTVKA